jgi:hypothetical protein
LRNVGGIAGFDEPSDLGGQGAVLLETSLRNLGWRPPVAKEVDHCLMAVTMEEVAPKTMVQMLEKLARYERRSTKVAGAT